MAKRQRINNHLEVEVEIPQGQSESVNQRRTDNVVVKRKKMKRRNNGLQNTTHETKDPSTRTTLNIQG
jgi:hypothetical protein